MRTLLLHRNTTTTKIPIIAKMIEGTNFVDYNAYNFFVYDAPVLPYLVYLS